ncbi:Tad domain-containing protein [Halorussus gelatinilyticus]|uniref:Tad domain-containing protein n=1 Tax=Halorussus gelatinilyticus TaxID=2937524 RepID=A0A8U0IKF8_9EURY|nr:Tad domain-containing protein [Halorussus gelatinilyticus]UPW00704.1 Tad domain-containing protein [Halorussus gelatinilyticus]
MGILEIHFHDSEFSWSMDRGSDGEESRSRTFSLGSGGESVTTDGGGERERPGIKPKLRSLAVMALVVGAGVVYNRLQRRRAQRTADAEAEAGGGSRLSRLRSR